MLEVSLLDTTYVQYTYNNNKQQPTTITDLENKLGDQIILITKIKHIDSEFSIALLLIIIFVAASFGSLDF